MKSPNQSILSLTFPIYVNKFHELDERQVLIMSTLWFLGDQMN